MDTTGVRLLSAEGAAAWDGRDAASGAGFFPRSHYRARHLHTRHRAAVPLAASWGDPRGAVAPLSPRPATAPQDCLLWGPGTPQGWLGPGAAAARLTPHPGKPWLEGARLRAPRAPLPVPNALCVPQVQSRVPSPSCSVPVGLHLPYPDPSPGTRRRKVSGQGCLGGIWLLEGSRERPGLQRGEGLGSGECLEASQGMHLCCERCLAFHPHAPVTLGSLPVVSAAAVRAAGHRQPSKGPSTAIPAMASRSRPWPPRKVASLKLLPR